MNRNQKRVFATIYITFCIVVARGLYSEGAFRNLDFIIIGFVAFLYLIAGFFIRKYVITNLEQVDKWFR